MIVSCKTSKMSYDHIHIGYIYMYIHTYIHTYASANININIHIVIQVTKFHRSHILNDPFLINFNLTYVYSE